MKVLVLAGGKGTRLWPYSRALYPKQFIHFGDGESLLEKTLNRFVKSGYQKKLWVSSNARFLPLIQRQCPDIQDRFIAEPSPKNTGPAILFAIKKLMDRAELTVNDCLFVTPSDHIISHDKKFMEKIEILEKRAKEGKIITFGIPPHRPETGYGYLKCGTKQDDDLFEVERFMEKPDFATAEQLIRQESVLWNSGMFLFHIKHFLQELKLYQPEYAKYLTGEIPFEALSSLSIDHAVMERSKDLLTCKLNITWSDVGSWDSVYELLKKDDQGNVISGNVYPSDTQNSLILAGKRLISTIGLRDMLILETEDALFISKRGKSQQVKEVVETLKGKRELEDHLHQKHPWGEIAFLDQGEKYTLEKITIYEGQAAKFSKARWTVLCGLGEMQSRPIKSGDQFEADEGVISAREKLELLCMRDAKNQ